MADLLELEPSLGTNPMKPRKGIGVRFLYPPIVRICYPMHCHRSQRRRHHLRVALETPIKQTVQERVSAKKEQTKVSFRNSASWPINTCTSTGMALDWPSLQTRKSFTRATTSNANKSAALPPFCSLAWSVTCLLPIRTLLLKFLPERGVKTVLLSKFPDANRTPKQKAKPPKKVRFIFTDDAHRRRIAKAVAGIWQWCRYWSLPERICRLYTMSSWRRTLMCVAGSRWFDIWDYRIDMLHNVKTLDSFLILYIHWMLNGTMGRERGVTMEGWLLLL